MSIGQAILKKLLSMTLILAGVFLIVGCEHSPVTQGEKMSEQANGITSDKEILLFVGTYTNGPDPSSRAKGIYLYAMNTETGALRFVSVSPETANPSFLAIHPNGRWVYAVNETGKTQESPFGGVSAFRFDGKDKLEFINAVSSRGTYPCHVSVDQSGKYVLVSNYGSGNVTVYPIGEGGRLEEASFNDQHAGDGPAGGQTPHAHMTMPSFMDNVIYSVDLGIDKIFLSTLDTAGGKLVSTDLDTRTASKAGPRHLTFHPNRKWAYVVNELNGTVESFTIDPATGAMSRFQTISTVPESVTGDVGCADIHITPSGKYLYASNRADVNTIAMFKIDPKTGELDTIGYQPALGRHPRSFAIDPSGVFLLAANRDSNNVVTFRIDDETGRLKETGLTADIPKPVCLKFYESGK